MTDRDLRDTFADALAFIITDYRNSKSRGDYENGTLNGAHWLMRSFGLDFGFKGNDFVIYNINNKSDSTTYEIVDETEAKIIESKNPKRHRNF